MVEVVSYLEPVAKYWERDRAWRETGVSLTPTKRVPKIGNEVSMELLYLYYIYMGEGWGDLGAFMPMVLKDIPWAVLKSRRA